jgi:hypothetical protein
MIGSPSSQPLVGRFKHCPWERHQGDEVPSEKAKQLDQNSSLKRQHKKMKKRFQFNTHFTSFNKLNNEN